jgi:hypothetical protein
MVTVIQAAVLTYQAMLNQVVAVAELVAVAEIPEFNQVQLVVQEFGVLEVQAVQVPLPEPV